MASNAEGRTEAALLSSALVGVGRCRFRPIELCLLICTILLTAGHHLEFHPPLDEDKKRMIDKGQLSE